MSSPFPGSSPQEPDPQHTREFPPVPEGHYPPTGSNEAPTEAFATTPSAPPVQGVPPVQGAPGPLSAMTPRHWWVPVVAGAGGYAATVLGAVITLVMILVGGMISADGSSGFTDTLDDEISDVTGVNTDFSGMGKLLAIPFQLAAMALLSPLRMVIEEGEDSAAFGLLIPLYFPLACGVLTAWLLARKLTAPLAVHHRGVQWVMAGVAGFTWALLAFILTAATQLRASSSFLSYTVSMKVTGLSVALIVVAILVGVLTVAHAVNVRVLQPAPGQFVIGAERFLPGSLQVLRPMVVHLTVFGVITGVLVVIGAFVRGGAIAGFSSIAWLPLGVGLLWVQSMFSAVVSPGRTTGVSSLTGSSDAAYLWSAADTPWWVVLLCIVIGLLATVSAAVCWAHVRPMDHCVARSVQSWVTLPVAYFTLGLLLMWLLRAYGYVDTGSVSGSGEFLLRPAGWTCVVLLLWGLVIEVLARFVVPHFASALPAGVTRALRGPEHMRHRAAVVATAAGAGVVARGMGTAYAQPHAHPEAAAQDATAVYGAQTPSYADGAPMAAGFVPKEPMDPAKKKRLKVIAIITAAILALLVVALIAFSTVSRTMYGPDKTVERYMDAVVAGDASKAAELKDPNVSSEQRALLTNDVLKATDNRIDSYRIADKKVEGAGAMVTVDVTQDNVTTPKTFVLASDGREGLFKSWRLDSSRGDDLYQKLNVMVPAGVEELVVNEQAVTVPQQSEDRTVEFTALPGDYAVSIPAAGKYVTYGDAQTQRLRVDSPSFVDTMHFEQTTTPALKKDLATKLNAQLDECAKKAEFEPADCAFSYTILGDEEDYRNPVWTIKEYPTYSVSESLGGVYFTTDDAGKVRLDYQYNEEWDDDEPADWANRDYDQSIYFSGKVTVEGDTIKVEDN